MPENSHNIDVKVQPAYLKEQSDPQRNHYVFAYTVTISNTGNVAAKLLTRHWIITDGDGVVQEVRGDGVIGEQPHLRPSEGFEYTSGTFMNTPVGAMQGSYQMITDDGETFDVAIPSFTLSVPHYLN